jgi:hypothetical protein
VIGVTEFPILCDRRHRGGDRWTLEWRHLNRADPADAGETTMATRTNKAAKKDTNYEGRFFGMIALAWVLLTFAFNVLHGHLPQAKNAATAKAPRAAASVPHIARVASLH